MHFSCNIFYWDNDMITRCVFPFCQHLFVDGLNTIQHLRLFWYDKAALVKSTPLIYLIFDIFLQIALNSQRNRCFLSSRLNIIWASSFCLSTHTLSIQVLFNKRIGLLDKFSSSYVWWKVYHKENLTRNSTSLTAAFMWR